MPYKVFDFECKECDSGHVEHNVMIDMEKEEVPLCPHCGGKMVIKVGTAFVPHVSWSQWKVG